MRRVLTVVLWTLATVGAAAIAWSGVRAVSEEVTTPRAATLSADVVIGELRSAASTTTTAAADTTTTASAPDDEGPPAPPSSEPRPSSPSATATTAAPSGTSTTVPGAPSTTVDRPARVESRTITGRGGAMSVGYLADGTVVLDWARPEPGFQMEVLDDGPGELDVRFRSEAHETRLRAAWDEGVAAERVEEKAR